MKRTLLAILVLTLIGCAGTGPMKSEDRNRLSSVTISDDIKTVKPYFYGTDESAGFFFAGALGMALVQASRDKSAEENYLLSNNIDIRQIVKEHLTQELTARGVFKIVGQGEEDAELEISINHYGFGLGGEFMNFNVVKPMLNVSIKITDKTGAEIWAGKEFITNMSGLTEKVKNDELKKNPVIAERNFRHVSKLVVKLLVAQLEGREIPESELTEVKVDQSELLSTAMNK